MRKKKPTLAGLKRQLEAVQRDFDQELAKNVQLLRDLREAQAERDEAVENFRKSDKALGWYERQREEQLRYFDESLLLFKPHLVPDPATNSIQTPANSLDRFLLHMRERLTRHYDSLGRNLYASPDWRTF